VNEQARRAKCLFAFSLRCLRIDFSLSVDFEVPIFVVCGGERCHAQLGVARCGGGARCSGESGWRASEIYLRATRLTLLSFTTVIGGVRLG
jgi:hypothetical protein